MKADTKSSITLLAEELHLVGSRKAAALPGQAPGMIDQSRAIDDARLKRRVGMLPRTVLAEVNTRLRRLGDL